MNIQVTFTESEIEEIMSRPYDCVDYEIRRSATKYLKRLNEIDLREKSRKSAMEKIENMRGTNDGT